MVGRSALQRALRDHFKGLELTDIVTAARDFPITSRVDVHTAIEQLAAQRGGSRLLSIHSPMNHQTPTIAHLMTRGPFPIDIGPLQHDEVDVGDAARVRCLKNGAAIEEMVFVGGTLNLKLLGGSSADLSAIGDS